MSDGTDNPLMGAAFARTYAQVSDPLTGPIATMALDRLRPFAPGARLLDIAAGTGALAVPAAELGLAVLAIDIAPGMVEHLACRLRPYPAAEARIMDGQDLALGDAEFDVATSMFGLHYFADWRRGLTEMARVLRSGGRAAVAGWRGLNGGPPAAILRDAFGAALPAVAIPGPPEAMRMLSDPALLTEELTAAGFTDIAVEHVERRWSAPAGAAYLEQLGDFHSFFPPYAALDDVARHAVDAAVAEATESMEVNARIDVPAHMILATATKP